MSEDIFASDAPPSDGDDDAIGYSKNVEFFVDMVQTLSKSTSPTKGGDDEGLAADVAVEETELAPFDKAPKDDTETTPMRRKPPAFKRRDTNYINE